METSYLAQHKKKSRKLKAFLGFLDESGFSDRPVVRRTWAPKGKTPTIRDAGSWTALSAIATLVTSSSGRRVKLLLKLQRGSVHGADIQAYLKDLKRHLKGHRLLLLWDHLGAHRHHLTQEFLRNQKSWLTTEWLPSYAPELNPTEYLWSYLKGTAMANYCGDGPMAVASQVQRAAKGVQRQAKLERAFLKHSGLFPMLR